MLLIDPFNCLFTSSQLSHDSLLTRTHFLFHTQTLSHVSILHLLLRSKVCAFPAGIVLGRNPTLMPHFLLSADSPHLYLSLSAKSHRETDSIAWSQQDYSFAGAESSLCEIVYWPNNSKEDVLQMTSTAHEFASKLANTLYAWKEQMLMLLIALGHSSLNWWTRI